MDGVEALARVKQLKRERDALDGSYADLMKELAEWDRGSVKLIARFVNYIEMERAQSSTLSDLVADAYQGAIKAVDIRRSARSRPTGPTDQASSESKWHVSNHNTSLR